MHDAAFDANAIATDGVLFDALTDTSTSFDFVAQSDIAQPDMAIRRLAPGQPIPSDFTFDGYLMPGAVRASPAATNGMFRHVTIGDMLKSTTHIAVVCSFAAW